MQLSALLRSGQHVIEGAAIICIQRRWLELNVNSFNFSSAGNTAGSRHLGKACITSVSSTSVKLSSFHLKVRIFNGGGGHGHSHAAAAPAPAAKPKPKADSDSDKKKSKKDKKSDDDEEEEKEEKKKEDKKEAKEKKVSSSQRLHKYTKASRLTNRVPVSPSAVVVAAEGGRISAARQRKGLAAALPGCT